MSSEGKFCGVEFKEISGVESKPRFLSPFLILSKLLKFMWIDLTSAFGQKMGEEGGVDEDEVVEEGVEGHAMVEASKWYSPMVLIL